MPNDDTRKTLKTTTMSMKILKLLSETDGARVAEIAERMDAPTSTVHGHLTTLEAEQFVFKRGGIYFLGSELLRLGSKVRTRREEFIQAREFTKKLFDEIGFRSIFVIEMAGRAVFIHTASGSKMRWTHENLGNRLYLHNTAVGKAILAEHPSPRVEQILDKWGMPQETERTITDREKLFSELEEARENGYAVNHGENIKGLHAIGAAATERSGNIIGAFSVTGPKNSFTGEEREREIAESVLEIVDEYELEILLA